MTGETKPDRLREVANSGVAVLYKPVSPKVLRQAINAQLAAVRQRCSEQAERREIRRRT